MVRDEEANLRANLGEWSPVADFLVCGIDERTSDNSARAVVQALDVPRWIFYFRFQDFAQGRSLVLREAWRKFPNATHVLTLDPDWTPRNLDKAELDFVHSTYLFLVYDRNKLTTRTLNWLVRHEQGLSFQHRLHEQLRRRNGSVVGGLKRLSWEMTERDDRVSWHDSAHGHSQSYERYLKDLDLLALDLVDFGDRDLHTLYYLGATHLSALEAMIGIGEHARNEKTDFHIYQGIKYLERRLSSPLALSAEDGKPLKNDEQTWAAMRWLGHANHYYTRNLTQAESWYLSCRDYDPHRVDCPTFLAALYRETRRNNDAWKLLFSTLQTTYSDGDRSFANNFYVYQCALPLEAGLVLLALLLDPSLPHDSNWHVMLVFGDTLLSRAIRSCDDPTRRYITQQPASVEDARLRYAALRKSSLLPWAHVSEACVPLEAARSAAKMNDSFLDTMRSWDLLTCPIHHGSDGY